MRLWVWLAVFVLGVYYMAFVDPGETGDPQWLTITIAIVASIIAATVVTGAIFSFLGFLQRRR